MRERRRPIVADAFLTTALSASCAIAAACARGSMPEAAPVDPVAGLRVELESIFSDPALENAHWGIMVQSVETGEVFYRENATKLFVPASNQKLITAAVALATLGPDYRFVTHIAATDTIGSDGTLQGDLVIIGAGDPALSERFFGDPTGVFRAWADSLRTQGIAAVAGDVVGDDDRYDDVHLGPGWTWDDLGFYYAAEIGALLYNEGAINVIVMPGDSAGSSAVLRVDPPTGYLTLANEVVTVADSTDLDVETSLDPFTNNARIFGEIRLGGDSLVRYIAPHDPTLLFVNVLLETLEAEGIDVAGEPLDGDLGRIGGADSLHSLFVHTSPTLAEIVSPFLKRSQNQIGEMLLRELGAAATDTGSISAGRRAVERTLTSWGVPESYYIYVDGSGLSRYNFSSPEAITRLLRVMARRPEFEVFYEALPVAGVDGTLQRRMIGSAAAENARAKTGYVSRVRSLSGYVTTADGELLAFSMIANGFSTPVRTVEYLQDLAVERLANFRR